MGEALGEAMCEWSPTCAKAAELKPAVAAATRAASETFLNERRMVFLMGERSDMRIFSFTLTAGALSIHFDKYRAAFDRGGVGLHRDHAGRRHDLAGFDVELAVVEVALDHVAIDEALR